MQKHVPFMKTSCHLSFRRPQTDQSLEQFIRAKYEAKRYIMKGWAHPPVDIADLPIYFDSMIRDKKVIATFSTIPKISSKHPVSTKQPSQNTSRLEAETPQLIDFVSSPKSDHFNVNQTAIKRESNSIDDLFGPIVSAAPAHQDQKQELLFASQTSALPFSQSSPNFNHTDNDLVFSRAFSGTEQVNVGIDQKRHDSPDKLPNNPLNDQESLNSNLIGFDLQGIDFTLCSIAGNENQEAFFSETVQTNTINPTTVSTLPPASDAKKSTSEILALFNK
ncbi:hypothetical protein Mgra_00007430 [Meloidogyne graminicola]|uniref:Uncharacterized protein n=1 Tax=Meloidogyne graminicola TaxID=189291 RepID=A0A8S9ZIY2_9BILA|nr:hypothetical protein Mgra_00007430 [Meloidogyne graminicola]